MIYNIIVGGLAWSTVVDNASMVNCTFVIAAIFLVIFAILARKNTP